MRIFASDRMRAIMKSLGMEKGEAIEHRMVTNAIEKAQRKVEARNFDMRKNVLEYDDVANDQRQIIYRQRNELMEAEDVSETIESIRHEVVRGLVDQYIPTQSIEEQWDIEGLEQALLTEFNSRQPLKAWLDADDALNEESLKEKILAQIIEEYRAKESAWREQGIDMRVVEKQIMLQILDQRWKEHLATMDHLRQGIHLRAYAQKQPKQEYKREAFELFQELLSAIDRDVVRLLSRVQIERQESIEEIERRRREEQARRMRFMHEQAASALNGDDEDAPVPATAQRPTQARQPQASQQQQAPKPETFVRQDKKVGRNEPCPCGSGKKFKHCHGSKN